MVIISSAQVTRVIKYGDLTREYLLQVKKPSRHEPGQFIQLALDQVSPSSPWPDSRPYSIANYSKDGLTIRIIVKKKGTFSTRIFNELVIGKECFVKYPYGILYFLLIRIIVHLSSLQQVQEFLQ